MPEINWSEEDWIQFLEIMLNGKNQKERFQAFREHPSFSKDEVSKARYISDFDQGSRKILKALGDKSPLEVSNFNIEDFKFAMRLNPIHWEERPWTLSMYREAIAEAREKGLQWHEVKRSASFLPERVKNLTSYKKSSPILEAAGWSLGAGILVAVLALVIVIPLWLWDYGFFPALEYIQSSCVRSDLAAQELAKRSLASEFEPKNGVDSIAAKRLRQSIETSDLYSEYSDTRRKLCIEEELREQCYQSAEWRQCRTCMEKTSELEEQGLLSAEELQRKTYECMISLDRVSWDFI